MIIDADPGMTVAAEAANGREAVELARSSRVDIVLMDIRMPAIDGIEATRRICADNSVAAVRVLVLTTFDNDDNVVLALQAGASGFLGKNAPTADLLNAVRLVAAGEALLSPAATRGLIGRFLAQLSPPAPPAATALDTLTDRERELMILVAHGLSNHDIAKRLHVSPLTAKTHIHRAMTKLNARDRAQLVVLAYQSGRVKPGSSLPEK